MSEEQQSLTGRKDLAPVPEPGMNEDQLAQFIPHRALRPEKTEGGKAFGFVSDFEPAGDQPLVRRRPASLNTQRRRPRLAAHASLLCRPRSTRRERCRQEHSLRSSCAARR